MATLLARQFDIPLHHTMAESDRPALQFLARQLSLWGDYISGTLILSAGLWFLAPRASRWKRAGLACFVAATLAWSCVHAVKFATGRPRPYMSMEDGFYGPRPDNDYRSFPSGHAATSMATASALGMVVPAAAAPALVITCGVAWSRLYLDQHYLSDVVAGALIGALFGVMIGRSLRSP